MKVPGIPYHQGKNQYTDRDGKKYGIAIHNTSNTGSDTAESMYADHRVDGISSHFYADGDSVTQSIDTDYRVGHAGSYEGNEHAIVFEITGTNDKSREWWLANVAWAKLGYVIAYMIKNDPDLAGFQIRRASVSEMKTNPRIKAFYGHNDMRLAWGGTTHTDPGPNFPWDKLISSVKAEMSGSGEQEGDDDMFTKYGEQGPKVEFLQLRLNNLGFDVGTVDGDYGDKTKTALGAALKQAGSGADPAYYGPAATITLDGMWAKKFGPPPSASTMPTNVTIVGTLKAS